tara:strand:- start:300 stop:485 length:186 start_codon:yes stop_codon:yes gene_type:complete
MELNQNNNDINQDLVDVVKADVKSQMNEDLNYLYPYGHRITHQMKCFKGIRDRDFEPDIVS